MIKPCAGQDKGEAVMLIVNRHRLFFLIFSFILFSTAVYAYDASLIKAYPVPFNPKVSGVMRIDVPAGYRVSFIVFDFNGDMVTKRTFTSAASSVSWNGRNNRGSVVKPGLYIIKVVVENDADGDYGKKMIRILVKY